MNRESILENFSSSIERGRTAHAYLVSGPVRRGCGPLAVEMAQKVLCLKDQSGCGECAGCLKVAGRSHPDMVWIEPRMKSRRISVEDVRALQELIYQTAYMGSWKVCVVSGADRMTREAANALLKSLEEPPARSMFMLLAENVQYLLPTIISRCQRFDLTQESSKEDYEWYGELVDILASVGSGVVNRMDVSYRLAGLLKGIKSGIEAAEQEEDDFSEDMEDKVFDARVSSRYREERTAVMKMIVLWYRDILLLSSGGTEPQLFHGSCAARLRELSEGLSVRSASANIDLVEEMAARFERNMGEDAVLLDGFSRLVGAA